MKIKEGEKLPNSKVFILSKDGPKEISIGEIVGRTRNVPRKIRFLDGRAALNGLGADQMAVGE